MACGRQDWTKRVEYNHGGLCSGQGICTLAPPFLSCVGQLHFPLTPHPLLPGTRDLSFLHRVGPAGLLSTSSLVCGCRNTGLMCSRDWWLSNMGSFSSELGSSQGDSSQGRGEALGRSSQGCRIGVGLEFCGMRNTELEEKSALRVPL